jgi:hypothetical protein
MASSSVKRSIENIETTNENIAPKKRLNSMHTPFQLKIIAMFEQDHLVAPSQLLGKKILLCELKQYKLVLIWMDIAKNFLISLQVT